MITIDPLVKLIICYAAVLLFAQIDGDHIRKGQYIKDHIPRYFLRALFVVALGGFNWIDTAGLILAFMGTFDNTLNLVTRKGFLYLGTVAKWDIFWTKHRVIYKTLLIVSNGFSIVILT